uniref:Uncharacterized protein n=1 Tax=Populus trichocarpa TaxID=3694 RepID=A0A2K1ZZJ5_POPTR
MHLIKSQFSEIPKKLNREVSYCSKVGVAKKSSERAEIEEVRTMVYGIKEEDVEWLKQSLIIGSISSSFNNLYDSMMTAFKSDEFDWGLFFDELRPWKCSYRAFDKFAWVTISGLPLAAYSKDCISSILAAQGKDIGYDLGSVSYSSISGVRVLLATSS